MTIVSLERRLRKLEAARGQSGYASFAAWGRTAVEAEQALEDARTRGAVRPGDEAMAFVWPHPDTVPRSRWISLSPNGEDDLSDRELEVMVAALQAAEAHRERDAALAAGEDVTGLDETDFLIRSIRRDRGDVTVRLRHLAMGRNPDIKTHWPETDKTGRAVSWCDCARCRAGETTPMGAHRLNRERMLAWMTRYLPGEVLFA